MSGLRNPESSDLPVFGADFEVSYTLQGIAELAGVDSQTVMRYQHSGFIQSVQTAVDDGKERMFDEECLRLIRRIVHLRATYAVNEAGLKLILDLMREVELLQNEQRTSR